LPATSHGFDWFPSAWCETMFSHAFTKLARLAGVALTGLANGIFDVFRRAGERRRLSELSSLERRDLGLHQVDHELNKWPWQN
jgi:hypothetical protein